MRVKPDAGASAAGAGLVPSINNGKPEWNTRVHGPWERPAVPGTLRPEWSANSHRMVGAEGSVRFEPAGDAALSPWLPPDSIKVDHVAARCTRLRKNLGIAAKWLSKGEGQAWMLTLTYRDDVEWKAAHVKEAIRHLRQWMQRIYGQRLRYVWVMETKARLSGTRVGEMRPHYHVVVWLPRDVHARDLHLDARGWWPHGMTNAVMAVAPVRYVMKYASKFDSKGSFPKGARCYGIGGMDSVGARCRRWINWPTFVQARACINTAVRRIPGGGWSVGGARFASEWAVSAIGIGYTRLMRVCTHPPTGIEPLGPYSRIQTGATAD